MSFSSCFFFENQLYYLLEEKKIDEINVLTQRHIKYNFESHYGFIGLPNISSFDSLGMNRRCKVTKFSYTPINIQKDV